jgi:RES domain-containing protein
MPGQYDLGNMRQKRHPWSRRIRSSLRRSLKYVESWSGTVYRAVFPRYATHTAILSGEGARTWGGRYTPRDIFAAVYASLDPQTALAEVLAEMQHQGLATVDAFPRIFVAIDVRLSRALDMTRVIAQRELGVTSDDLIADIGNPPTRMEESLTQAIGRVAWELKLEGLIVPSARRITGANLVIFPDRLSLESRVRVRRARRHP